MNENDHSFDTPSESVPQTPGTQNNIPQQPEVPYQAVPQAHPLYPYQPPRPAVYPCQPPRTVKQEKPKKKRMSTRVAVVALCCALLGSLLGGGAVGIIMRRMYEKDRAAVTDTAPTQQPTETIKQPSPAKPVSSGDFKTPAQIYEENVGAVVGISNESTVYNAFGQKSETASSGTGFVVSSDGEILTNYHVVENAQKLTVTLYDGREFAATVLGYEAESDTALLKIDATDLQTVTLGDSDKLMIGDEVAAIGNPLGELTYSITVGFLSAKDRAVNTDGTPINMMQIDAAINPGNSGGPLFDMNGNVIGITTAKYSGTMGTGASIEGIGFALPINDVLSILDDLRENGTVLNRAFIGITVSKITSEQKENGLPEGAFVMSVVPGGSGEKAGLCVGDVITALDGTAIKDSYSLTQQLKSFRGGDRAVFTVFRNGETLELPIVFDSKTNQTAAPTEPTEETVEETQGFDPFEGFGFDFPWGDLWP